MINYQPFQTFTLGPIDMKVWGLMFSIAIISGLIWALKRAGKNEYDHILNIGIIAMIGGVVGSRLAYIIIYPSSFANLVDIFKFWQGGMISYGGFIIGAFLSLAYLKSKKLNIYQYLDIFAIPLALSIAITRIGCFLNHCHLGTETDVFWGINYLGEIRHPISLYYSISALLITVILLIIERRTTKEGVLGASLLILYPIFRLAADQFAFYQPSTVEQINIIVLIIILIFGLYILNSRIKKRT